MKKKLKKCANPLCSNEFLPYKSTDKYCSFSCAKACFSEKKKIKKVSEKLKTENYIYSRLRKKFLANIENTYCPVALQVFNEKIIVSEIHHKAGRIGKLLNDTHYWLAVSRKGHIWVHENPQKAYELNFLIKSNQIKSL